jgi:hypothetical protein
MLAGGLARERVFLDEIRGMKVRLRLRAPKHNFQIFIRLKLSSSLDAVSWTAQTDRAPFCWVFFSARRKTTFGDEQALLYWNARV